MPAANGGGRMGAWPIGGRWHRREQEDGMILGLTETDARVAELRLREARALAEAERRAHRPYRPRHAAPTVAGGCRRLGAALVALGLRLQGPSSVASVLDLPAGQGVAAQ